MRAGRRLKNAWKRDGMIKVWTDAAEAGLLDRLSQATNARPIS